MSRTSAAKHLKEQARLYEQLAREATTDAVAELFRELARDCLNAAAEAEEGDDISQPNKKPER